VKVVYIAHPLGGGHDRNDNLIHAARWVAWAASQGVAPVADWITLAEQWDETPENRARGLAIDVALVARCDELWLCGHRISTGMRIEMNEAKRLNIPVVDYTTETGDRPASAPR
jgi:hypothetical protein